MKIGILTFHCAHNYGAVLQAYALQEYLKSLGHCVEVIDYRPEYLVKPYQQRFIYYNNLIKLLGQLLWIPSRILRSRKFDRFIVSNLDLSPFPFNAKEMIDKSYDAYVLGSDQIWNASITGGDPVFLGDFDRNEDSKIISYAASTEVQKHGENVNFLNQASYLANFSAISVREDIFNKQIQPYLKKPVQTVLDPTLMVDSSIFDSLIVRKKSSKYILVYLMADDVNVCDVIRSIKGVLDIDKVIRLRGHVGIGDLLNKYALSGPEDFVELFYNSDFVITTSFHGTAFAILFKKQFVSVVSEFRGSYRISSLLQALGLEDRMVYSINDIPKSNINYDIVESRLKELQKKSRDFLHQALAE
ncbi:polysaccharide pyruvyl transferase family protein [Methylobacillus sp. Pita1]|uniref:polysaccharide pyruvyl transferase family protein n=1 Tax=Methylobacillus sp. Pita1 TaxID=3382642 RepID=UPI0038B497E1